MFRAIYHKLWFLKSIHYMFLWLILAKILLIQDNNVLFLFSFASISVQLDLSEESMAEDILVRYLDVKQFFFDKCGLMNAIIV